MYFRLSILLVLCNVPSSFGFILGSQNQFNALTIQADGKIVAAGFTIIDNVQQFLVARFTPEGLLDTSFGVNGCQNTSIGEIPVAFAVSIDSADRIVVAGATVVSGVANIALARYLNNGTLDNSFGLNGIVMTSVESGCSGYAMILEPDDKITVTGSILQNDEVWIPLIQYNTDGTLNSSFGTNGVAIVNVEDCAIAYSIIKQSDNKYVVAGFAESQSFVARVNSDGSVDTAFGTNGGTSIPVGFSSSLRGIGLQSTQKIVAAGYSDGQCVLIRLNTDGTLDATFGDSGIVTNRFGAYNVLLDMLIDGSDRIVVAGVSDDTAISARYLLDGGLDTSFGNEGFASVICGVIGNANAIRLQTDNQIVIAGFSDNNGLLARMNSDGTFDSNFGINGLVLDPTDYFPTCVSDSIGTDKSYVFAYDTTNQTVSVASSYQDITFNTNSQLLGWSHSSSSAVFICNEAGVYQIAYTTTSEKTSGTGLTNASLRLTKNGTEIAGSQQTFDYATTNQTTVQSKTVIVTFASGDELKLQYTGATTTCRLLAGDGVGNVRPSVCLSIAQL